MGNKTDFESSSRLRLPLGVKLVGALLAVAIIMLGFLFGYFGPHANESFLEGSNGLIDLSREAMREMVHRNTSESADLLINVIRHTTDSRRRLLSDLPLSLYSGDITRIRQAIERADEEKSNRLQRNVEILAQEMEDRSLEDVKHRLDSLGQAQTAKSRHFASDIRVSYLVLAGTVFMLLVLLLGFGLYHTVVHPLQQLRKVTQAITRGDLRIDVPVQSKDEVGGLSADFAAMVEQLRESREDIRLKNDQLQELNHNLESEVARKTRHLEQALHDLRRAQKQLIHAEKMASI
ncbi:MAG: HAMP domain-containing protein, partial [Planctomycetota bacterium]